MWVQGLGEGGWWLMGMDFQFGKMKRFCRWMVVMVTQQCE